LIDEVLSGGEPRAEALGVALDDLLDVMQSLNVEINGETPSESHKQQSPSSDSLDGRIRLACA
jgi:hypothetical protein